MLATAACFICTACNPSLSLNPKYSYTSFDREIGDKIPYKVTEYIDTSGLNEEDADFVLANTEILYDGEPAKGKTYSDAGHHELTIKYCGRQYRKYDINVTDLVPPEFTEAKSYYTFVGLPLSEDIFDGMFAAEDNSGSVKVKVKRPEIDYYTAGDYKVTATATDPSGNKVKAKTYVHVQKPEYGAKGTYVFVSIAGQHLTYFVDGKPVMDCPVVTGNVYSGHGTPSGTFTVNYKARGVKLKGREDNGDEYESFVNYWMAFIGSEYGLHDALWRGSFGGSIYQGAGSHGCVNMPFNSAAELYEIIEPGTPVLIY